MKTQTTGFPEQEKTILRAVKGVGDTVIQRLEMMGFTRLEELANADVDDILYRGSELTGSSCWRNSPQARKAITSAIAAAKQQEQK
ncbi:recombinase RecA [Cardiobacteriaceae bacterium TAE3-ERU3]|nr:recombinase RecA [Cardiobacteriaceae bacterium TAE3-ERU3]